MPKWEYLSVLVSMNMVVGLSQPIEGIVAFHPSGNQPVTRSLDAITQLGQLGWEMVSERNAGNTALAYWFKRPVQP